MIYNGSKPGDGPVSSLDELSIDSFIKDEESIEFYKNYMPFGDIKFDNAEVTKMFHNCMNFELHSSLFAAKYAFFTVIVELP